MKKSYSLITVFIFALQAIFIGQLNAQCVTPTGLSATNVTTNGAYLYLTPTSSNVGTFNIRYLSNTSPNWITLEHITLPYQLGNLACGATYEWQAQLVCPNSTGVITTSDWSTAGTFTTLACPVPTPCNAPTGLSATNVSQTGAYLYLTPTSSNTGTFNIRYHGANVTTWTTVEHVTLPYQLGNLACGTAYEWQAQLICPGTTGTTLTTFSPWSTAGTFTTLACPVPTPCNEPTGLSATNVSQTGAYLYLTPTSSNTGTFNIRYHGANVTTWTYLEHVTLPYQLGNLACGTIYEWQAQLICTNTATGAITTSDWSTGGTFTTLACTVTPCETPTGLSATNVSQTGAYLYLSPTSSNTGTFNIRYHGANVTTWTTVEHVTLPYQLGNLACGTAYEWQAQLICPGTTATTLTTFSPWSTGGTFTTLACPVPTPCNAPTGLSATNVSQTGAYLYLTPTSSNTGTFNIRYHGANVTTWTTVEHITLPYQLGNLACGTAYEWQAQLICPAPAGTTAITVSPWSAGGTFTTLACTVTPCNAPTGLSATNVNQTGATLYLTPTSSNTGTFNIRYHGANVTTWTYLEHVTLPYQLGNLACGTTYEWQAQLICPAPAGTTTITVSPWSAGGTFTTLACTVTPCNAPTGLSATNVSQTGATLYLSPTSNNTGTFNIRYHGANVTTWTTVEHVTLPYQLGNLACGTAYEWQAQLICTNSPAGTTLTTVSPWSTGGTFTTLACTVAPCLAPTGLSATNVSQTGAYLYLTPTSSNTGTFNIRYQGANVTTWTTLEHVTLPYQLGNLACGIAYEWQAQLICPAPAGTTVITVSPWSTGGTFTTLACTVAPCNAPTGLSATNVSQTGAYLYLSSTSSNTGTFNIRYHGANLTTWTTVEHVTLPYQLGNLACGTAYEWQAQLICTNSAGATTSSDWSTGGTFTTLACTVTPCSNTPTGLSATNISQTGANLYLTPTSSNTGMFNIRYHGANVTTWTTVEHVTLPYQLGNLACDTAYEWQAQLICPAPAGTTVINVSPWSTGGTFTTLACTTTSCGTPTGLTTTDINPTSAILHWNAVSGAIAYIVRYKKANNTITEFTTVTTISTNVTTLNNLSAGSYYIWQVQAICSTTVGGLSPFSATAAFVTPSVTIFPNPAGGVVNVSFWLGTSSTVTIVLRNSQGQAVYSQVILGQMGTNSLEIDTSDLSDGLYFLSIQTKAYTTTKKIIISH